MTPRSIEVDAHVHIYPLFDPAVFLPAQPRLFGGSAGVWLLTESAGCCWFAQLAAGRLGLLAGWHASLREPNLALIETEGFRLWVVAGRQYATREGLEVHALGIDKRMEERRPVAEMVRDVAASGGVAAIPYGFGKWRGDRRRVLRDLVTGAGSPFLFSDSGVRPGRRAFAAAFPDLAAVPVLAGSDPLPLWGEEKRIGTFRASLELSGPEEDLTWEVLREALFHAREDRSRGRRVSLSRSFRQQAGLRLGGRLSVPAPDAPRHPDGGPTSACPDRESSGEDYATRFAGEAGQLFLQRQLELCRELASPWAGGSLLDVGGGHAQVAPAFARDGWEVTVAASEGAPRAILAREMAGFEFSEVTGDFLRLPFPDRSFDVVVGLRLVTHEPHWVPMLAEFARVARHAVIVDYPDIRSANLLYALLFTLKKRFEKNTRDYAVLSRAQVRAAFRPVGLDRIRIEPQFFFPMVVHRALKSGKWSRRLEALASGLGLVRVLGSPMIVCATPAAAPSSEAGGNTAG